MFDFSFFLFVGRGRLSLFPLYCFLLEHEIDEWPPPAPPWKAKILTSALRDISNTYGIVFNSTPEDSVRISREEKTKI